MTTTFGQVIRAARTDKGYSQRDLARLVEIDFTYLSKLENDRADYPPKEYVVQQIAYYLGLDYEELVCLTGRLPQRYHDFLKQNYQMMPALFRWMPSSKIWLEGILMNYQSNSLTLEVN